MNLDPFGDPFKQGGPGASEKIFTRPRSGAISRPKKADTAPAEEAASEPEPDSGAAAEEQAKPAEEKVVLSNPKWLTADVGFNEEAEISVQATLPEAHKAKTKVDFELFAKTPAGEESISKAQGNIDSGAAKAKVPVYIPQYKDGDGNLMAEVEYHFSAKHSASDLLKDESAVKKVDHMAVRLLELHILQDITFATGKSFVAPRNAPALKTLVGKVKEWKGKHADGKLAVFGHADAVGQDEPNKKLSERRASAVHAFLMKDPAPWKALYASETWGLRSTQELLKSLGHDPGAIDGLDGPNTQKAVKAFQKSKSMAESGTADEATREALYKAFMEAHNTETLAAKDFDVIDGKAFTGCGEYNLIENTQGAAQGNRRVAVLFLKSNKNFPITYPCKQGSIAPCKTQVAKKGARRTAGFKCHFYDQLVTEPAPVPVKEETELKGRLFWERTWDYMDETKPIAAIKEFLPGAKVELEIKKEGGAFAAHGAAANLTDGIDKALVFPHDGCGNFSFKAVPRCVEARLKVSLEYAGGKVVVVKGKTINGNAKFKDEADFKIHSGQTVFILLPLKLDAVDWNSPESDLGEVKIDKAIFVDLCDAYKTVWTGHKRVKEMTGTDLDVCQVNYPEDPDITVSNAGEQMQLCHDDLKDRAVILHEYGHFIGTKLLGGLVHPGYGYNDDPTNSHGRTTLEHYEAAWNEGHATFLSCALTDNPHYHDGYDTNLNFHLDKDGTKLGPHCEGAIQEALWAIYKKHGTDFKDGFWKAFTDRSKRTCRSILDFFENWKDLGLPKLDEVVATFKEFGMEFGYLYPDDKFKNVTAPKSFDEGKKEFATVAELHTHKGSLGAGTATQYKEEFYNRNKYFNHGTLKAGSSKTDPKVADGKNYIAPVRIQIKK
jgi:outer membrane protein OmpA-like peptidoglycan-associated protein